MIETFFLDPFLSLPRSEEQTSSLPAPDPYAVRKTSGPRFEKEFMFMNELTKKSAFGIAGMAGIAADALAMGVAGPAMASTSNTGIAATSTVSDTSQQQTSSNQWKSTDFRTAQEAQASAALEARVDAILNSQSRHNSATSQVSLSSTAAPGSSNSSTRDTNSAGTLLGATAVTSSTSSSAPASAAPTSQSSPTTPVDTQTQGAVVADSPTSGQNSDNSRLAAGTGVNVGLGLGLQSDSNRDDSRSSSGDLSLGLGIGALLGR